MEGIADKFEIKAPCRRIKMSDWRRRRRKMREGWGRCGVFDGGGEFALSLSLLKGTAVARLSSLVEIGGGKRLGLAFACICVSVCGGRSWKGEGRGAVLILGVPFFSLFFIGE